MTEEVQKPAAVYRNDEKDYDVSKLSPEGQQAFMLLAQLQQNELRTAEIATNHYQEGRAHYNSVIKANLSDDALIEEENVET